VGAGMALEDLETKTLQSAAMEEYELSLAEPDKMRVTEMRALMKMLNERRRLTMDREKQEMHLDSTSMLTSLKVLKGMSRLQTKEDYEEMMMQTADILQRARAKAAGSRVPAEKHEADDNGAL
jgi:hypothetical protein